MTKLFILTEKNTQAAKPFAQVLLGSTKQNKDGFYEGTWQGKQIIIGYMGGHLYEQYKPEDYSSNWSLRDRLPRDLIAQTPLLPTAWKNKPKEGMVGKTPVKQLLKKIEKAGQWADEIYLSTDPDQEGTVLGRECLTELGLMSKVTKRIGVHVMAESDIHNSFLHPDPIHGTDDLLYQAGLERQHVDWMGGIAAACLMKSENSLKGLEGKGTGSIGRVKTGTLSYIADINDRIEHWNPNLPENNSYVIEMTSADGLVLKSKKSFETETEAKKWLESAKDSAAQLSARIERKDTLADVKAPEYLSKAIIGAYGAKNGIKDVMPLLNELALSGYISYPRTVINFISHTFRDENLAPRAEKVRDLLGLTIPLPNKNSFEKPWVNDQKVKNAGHTANTYGDNIPDNLSSLAEKNCLLYRFIALRTLAPMMPMGKDSLSTYTAELSGLDFTATSRTISELGWREVPELAKIRSSDPLEEDGPSRLVSPGIKNITLDIKRIQKNPPKRVTRVNIEMVMAKFNLGTSATQSQIIQEMFDYGQLKDSGKYLEVTELGLNMVRNQPLFTFESTKELGQALLDIQGLGESNTPAPSGIVLSQILALTKQWREDLLRRLPEGFSYYAASGEKSNFVPKEKANVTSTKGKEISFNKKWGSKEFSENEISELSLGHEITFEGPNSKSVTGSLKHQSYNGKKYVGFMPNFAKGYAKAKGA